MINELTAARLRELLSYDPATGVFTWRVNPSSRRRAGDAAGALGVDGRWVIGINGRVYYANRLAWLYMTGEWPKFEVDHRNGARADTRWANLRDVTRKVNAQNMRQAPRGKVSGLPLGVSVDKRDGALRANIRIKGKQVSLGRFSDPAAAHAAYVRAKREHHDGCTI